MPDGYTVLHSAPAVIINPLIYKKLQYNVHNDFVPVTQVAAGVGFLMLVNASLPAYNVKEFIALAKLKSLAYGSPPAIVNKLHAAVREALKSPKVLEFLDAAAFYPVGSTPKEFREFVDVEMKRYAEMVRDARIPQQ